jgi:hypothetical protein
MSSIVVRTKFRDALQAMFPAVPYHEVYGVDLDNEDLEPLWVALEFTAIGEERISIGAPSYWHETGVARVVIVAESGQGEDAAVLFGDAVKDAFRDWQDTASGLRVLSVVPPTAAAPVSDGKWIAVMVELSYQREFFA